MARKWVRTEYCLGSFLTVMCWVKWVYDWTIGLVVRAVCALLKMVK